MCFSIGAFWSFCQTLVLEISNTASSALDEPVLFITRVRKICKWSNFKPQQQAVRPACASRWNVAKFNFCQVTPAKGLKTLSQMTSKCCENLWDSWSGRTEPSVLVLDETWPNGLRRLIKPSLMTSRMREHPKICWSTWEKWVNESWWKETCFRWMKQCDEDEEDEDDRRRDEGLKQDEEDADTKRWRR